MKGLGKTVIKLTAVNDLKYNRFAVSKVLVIAPKKVAEATWEKEAAKWDHLKMLRVITVLGPLNKRIKALNTPADIYVINRENVSWLVEYFRNSWPFDMAVVDEFSSFKNHQAKRFKSLTWVRRHIKRFVGLTGTPAPNGLIDLWAQVYLLDEGKRLGKHITKFRERYFDPDQRNKERVFTYAPKLGADETIKNLISDIYVSMKAEDYLELPTCTTVTVPVVLDKKASAAYGLNLQKGGNHVIWFGLNWSLELYQQANKRLHRQGQTEKVIIHRIVVEGGVDEDVIAALEDKGVTQEILMNSLKARIEKYKK